MCYNLFVNVQNRSKPIIYGGFIMVSYERITKILEILSKRKIISTTQLESLMFCSTSTLRRDLIQLEKDGKIIRSHGEVRLVTTNNVEYTYESRRQEETSGKQHIAETASTFLTDNQSIFIDGSSTAALLVPYFSTLQNLRVITNGLEIARQLNRFDNITLFFCGGHIDYGTNSALGDFASQFINNFHADICFMSCRGLDRFGSYEANYNQALLKQQMIANSDLTVLLADSSKFHTSHYFKLANYNVIDYIITNEAPVESFQDTVNKQCEILW